MVNHIFQLPQEEQAVCPGNLVETVGGIMVLLVSTLFNDLNLLTHKFYLTLSHNRQLFISVIPVTKLAAFQFVIQACQIIN